MTLSVADPDADRSPSEKGGDRVAERECPRCGELVASNKLHIHLPCGGEP